MSDNREFINKTVSKNPFESVLPKDSSEFKKLLKDKQNEFLDSFSTYQKKKTPIQKSLLQRKAMDLEILDPNFNFIIE